MSADVASDEKPRTETMLRLSTDVVASYLANNAVAPEAIPELIHAVHHAFAALEGGAPAAPALPAEKQKPAAPVNRSIQPDHLVCLEDGKKLKMLKRYLRSKFDMSPDDYRRKWNLPADYPMVAPAYATRRSEFAKQIGLGKGVRRAKA